MVDLIGLRRQLSPQNDVTLLNLATLPFAGATAYILNPRSRGKIAELLNAVVTFDIPYDLYLRELIYAKKLRGFVLFPFVTSLSNFSRSSQIQTKDTEITDMVWNLFRKMIWNERKLITLKPVLDDIRNRFCDEDAKSFAILFAAMASKNFKTK